jgi:hypothetical protein
MMREKKVAYAPEEKKSMASLAEKADENSEMNQMMR